MRVAINCFKITSVFFILLAFVNCGSNNDPISTQIPNYPITGNIDSYKGTIFDSISVLSTNVYGTGHKNVPVILLSDGTFSMIFTNPDKKFFSSFYSNITCSDPTALQVEYRGGDEGFLIFNGKNNVGKIYKSNMTLTEFQKGHFVVGNAFSSFIYVNKDVSIKGTNSWKDFHDEIYRIENYDITLKKGWNEIVLTYTSIKDNLPYNVNWTNSIPSGMNWIIDAFITPKDLLGTAWRTGNIGFGYDYEEFRFTTINAGEIWIKYSGPEYSAFKADTFSYSILETTITITAGSGDRQSGMLWRNTMNFQGFTFTKQ